MSQTTQKMRILLTGAAGFIGFHVAKRLLADGSEVFGIDHLNAYYDIDLKRDRLRILLNMPSFKFAGFDLSDEDQLDLIFRDFRPTHVLHLAAQPGVRYGSINPHAYIASNIVGFMSIIERCRAHHVEHFLYASSSSVYGGLKESPFRVDSRTDSPLSLYAATKKSDELITHSYSHLYGIPSTGMRFFTVYGPWGRPDMAMFAFVDNIANDRPIEVFAHGKQTRDMTYIDDVVECMTRLLPLPPKANKQTGLPPYRIVNIGNSNPVTLLDFIAAIETSLGKSAIKHMCPAVAGDVTDTYADTSELVALIGTCPQTSVAEGVKAFVDWYKAYMISRGGRPIEKTPHLLEVRASTTLPATPRLSQSRWQQAAQRLSFIIRNRGESDWIGTAIQSVLDAAGAECELIIVDNGSTDGSRELVEVFRKRHTNIKIIDIGTNSYTPGKSLNLGMDATLADPNRIVGILSAHCQIVDLDVVSLVDKFDVDPMMFGLCGKQIPVYRGKRIDLHSVWANFGIEHARVNPLESGSTERRYFFHNAFSFIRRSTWEQYRFDEKVTSKEDRLYALEMVDRRGMFFSLDPAFTCHHFWTQHGATWRQDYALAPIPKSTAEQE